MEKNDQNDQNVKEKISKENTNKGNFFLIGNSKFPTYGTTHLTDLFHHVNSNWTHCSFL